MFPVIGHAYLRQKFHISWVSSPLQLQILQSIPTPTTLVCESQTLFIENWESLTQFFSNNGVWYSLTPASVPQSINANNNIPFNDPFMPSVLRRCWLGGRKGIRSVKNWVVGCWRGYLCGARCRLVYSPADATATQSLTVSFLVLAHPGSPRQRFVKWVCVMTLVIKWASTRKTFTHSQCLAASLTTRSQQRSITDGFSAVLEFWMYVGRKRFGATRHADKPATSPSIFIIIRRHRCKVKVW